MCLCHGEQKPGSWYQELATNMLLQRSWYTDFLLLVAESWYQDFGISILVPSSEPGTKILEQEAGAKNFGIKSGMA